MKKEEAVVVVIVVAEPVQSEASTRSRSSSRAYDEGWERIFASRQESSRDARDLN